MPLLLGSWFDDARSAAGRARSSLAEWIEYRTIGLRAMGASWRRSTFAFIETVRNGRVVRALNTVGDSLRERREERRVRAALRPTPLWRQWLDDRFERCGWALRDRVEEARLALAYAYGSIRRRAESRAMAWKDWWTLRVRYTVGAWLQSSTERVLRVPCVASVCARVGLWTPAQRRAALSLTFTALITLPATGAWIWSSSSIPAATELELAQLARLRTGTKGSPPAPLEELPWLRTKPRP